MPEPARKSDLGAFLAEQLKRADIPARDVAIRHTDSGSQRYEERLREAQVSSEETRNAIEGEHLNKLRQQQRQRRAFFLWAMIAISSVLVASAVFMSAYMIGKGNQTEPAVIIAWLSSGLVETLGLGYIIANYLFEQSGSAPSKRKQRKRRGGKSQN